MKVLDLFSGIGGFSLGLERAGMTTVAFCEMDGYACRVLRKHWPNVPIFEDVRTLNGRRLKSHGIEPEILCGGFPCQDISAAGKGAGLTGARSGLWNEFYRLIREIRPRYAIVENVARLRSFGLDRVLGDLAAIGFDAEWHCIPACAVGANHERDRIWIVAYPKSHNDSCRSAESPSSVENGWMLESVRVARWSSEPRVGRVANGVPHQMDRLRCLGNAVVPQITEMIGRAIIRREKHQ